MKTDDLYNMMQNNIIEMKKYKEKLKDETVYPIKKKL